MDGMRVGVLLVAAALVGLGYAAAGSFGAAPAGPAEEAADPPAPAKAAGGAAVARPETPLTVDEVIGELGRQFQAGGTTMYFILFLSVLGLAFVLERLFRLRRRAIAPAGLAAQADGLWQNGDFEGLASLCEKGRPSTLAKVVLFIVRHRANPIDNLNTATGDIASREMARHMMLTYPLAIVAVLSPLLGLFGTVVGMIESFEVVAVAGTMGDPSLLASSISKALVTTAFGLIVAMPMLFFYHMFKLRTHYLASLLEEEAGTLLNGWLLKKEDAHAR